jgi:uncharacterized protein (TIGR02266 family)
VDTDVAIGGEGRVTTGVSSNVSTGGMFVAAFAPMPVGAPVSIKFRLPTGQVVANGIVRWAREGRPGVISGMGIEFVEMDELDRETLKRFCGDLPGFVSHQEGRGGRGLIVVGGVSTTVPRRVR